VKKNINKKNLQKQKKIATKIRGIRFDWKKTQRWWNYKKNDPEQNK
jgi:hypothetical protein